MAHNQEKPHSTPYHSLIYISTYHWLQHEKLTLQCAGRLGLQLGEDVERVEVHAGDGDVVAVHLGPAVLRIRDVYIPDPGSKTATKERGEKKICCHTFFFSHKFNQIENYFSFFKC